MFPAFADRNTNMTDLKIFISFVVSCGGIRTQIFKMRFCRFKQSLAVRYNNCPTGGFMDIFMQRRQQMSQKAVKQCYINVPGMLDGVLSPRGRENNTPTHTRH